ncbi:family 16 glycoside hydrolase [Umbelopsis sp. PMI_123]|nr:family 16 glycoside hydrolase [Umbelopsis sp. PMI_123]
MTHLNDPDFDTSYPFDWMKPNIRGWGNTLSLLLLILCLLGVFILLPLSLALSKEARDKKAAQEKNNGYNSTSPPTTTVPTSPGGRSVIDPDTPLTQRSRISLYGEEWKLVFSDEFNTNGRTFYPGDDPFWEAVDLHYWLTEDLEWYSPEMVTTEDGSLKITMANKPIHNLNYRSGMLQSWNKLCFTGGLLEVNLSLPGPPDVPGFWPGVWTLGNLARPGYGASTDGMWPYSYDSCDIGVTPNQSFTTRSYIPGQRINRCMCGKPSIENPYPGRGRGAPEIDILEAAGSDDKFGSGNTGSVSQSAQFAPFDYHWQANISDIIVTNKKRRTIGNNGKTIPNTFQGNEFQQAVSYLTEVDTSMYDAKAFQTYAFEYVPSNTAGKQSYIRWLVNGEETWRMYDGAVGPNNKSQVWQRLISVEPMSIVLNFGMSKAFGPVDLSSLIFPSYMYVDYIRLYQSPDRINLDCDPADHPTSEYIKNHYNAYMNPNLTTWEQAGYSFPAYSLNNSC